jgi:hypothetical protein
MREVPELLAAAWESGTFVGSHSGGSRNAIRATIQKIHIALTNNGEWVYASALFPQLRPPRELPNIRKLTWNRDTQTPTAGATLEMYNYKRLPMGVKPPAGANRVGRPGFYTPRRGVDPQTADLWSQTSNEWRDWLVYDRVIRTYEGYGADPTVIPELDPNMMQTGVWLVCSLDFGVGAATGGGAGSGQTAPSASGSIAGVISVTLKDLGRQLDTDNIIFPPIIPTKKFPLRFDPWTKVRGPDKVAVTGRGWSHPTYSSDSGIPYNGVDGTEYGHRGRDAFDGSTATYWMSVGNDSPDADFAYEYIQGNPATPLVSAVRARVWGGGYRVYLSVHTTTDGWLGRATIGYNPSDPISAPNGSNIPFVEHISVDTESEIHFKPKTPWTNVDQVRLTFHHLYDSGIGPYPYRAGVRDFQTTGEAVTRTKTYKHVGYREYTDIIKLLCAWGGFFWPAAHSKGGQAWSDGSIHDVTPTRGDSALGATTGKAAGRVWGDFQNTGTGPITSITPDQLDKQPIYTAIQIIQETIGFLFYIDETGGVIWRMPNYFKLGNWVLGVTENLTKQPQRIVNRPKTALLATPGPTYITHTPESSGSQAGRTLDYITITDRQRMTDFTTTLSGDNVREKVFVGNLDGANGSGMDGIAAIVDGRNPYPSGFRRVSGWLDQHFESKAECARMADLIALAQYMTLWQDTITIAGYPAIQIDDQVLVQEETTAETNFHYVSSISSTNDMEGGTWTYQLSTNWLGTDPSDPSKWIFDPKSFDAETTTYLKGLGLL